MIAATTKTSALCLILSALLGGNASAQAPDAPEESERSESAETEETGESGAEAGLWDRVLAALGWRKSTSIILRGRADSVVEGYGMLWSVLVATGEDSPLGLDETIRSPVPAAHGEQMYALTDDDLIRFTLSGNTVTERFELPEVDTPQRLLLAREDELFALTDRGCIAGFDGSRWRTRTCGLSELQRVELIERSRGCGTSVTGVRLESGPPARADVILREGRLSRRLTSDPERRANYDPVFSNDCSRIYYVSRDRY